MQAEAVWRVWRRILTSRPLGDAVLSSDYPASIASFHLGLEEIQIMGEYAARAQWTRWAIATYRHRMLSSAVHALEVCAPLTRRALENRSCDLRQLAEACLDATGWIDRGPYVYSFGRHLLDHVSTTLPWSAQGDLMDLVSVERAGAELTRSLADEGPDDWAVAAGVEASLRGLADPWLERSRTARVVRTTHVLAPWLTDKARIGLTTLESGTQVILVYYPSRRHRYRLMTIGESGDRLLDMLSHPRRLSELLDRRLLADERSAAMLDRFVRIGAVRATPAPV